jgi:large subunit ribosomal protein L6
MSKIGTQELKLPSNLKLTQTKNLLKISSNLGSINYQIKPDFYPELIQTSRGSLSLKLKLVSSDPNAEKRLNSLWGTEYSLLKNQIEGLSKGFKLVLKLKGVGFKAILDNSRRLRLKLGYSHDVLVPIPSNLIVNCPKQDQIILFGTNKRDLTKFGASLKRLKKKDPYKGKGILLENEEIVLKEGKKK